MKVIILWWLFFMVKTPSLSYDGGREGDLLDKDIILKLSSKCEELRTKI